MNHTIDDTEHTIRFERTLAASPEAVFDAWTNPVRVTSWWDPSGSPLVACSIDLRRGGSFRFETSGHAPPFAGTYLVIEPPQRLEFEAMGAIGTVLLERVRAGTHMRVTIRSPSREHFETFLRLGVADGTSVTLDRLVEHVGSR
jgi:uncharacterized protein YndB with AHSA1/START domain